MNRIIHILLPLVFSATALSDSSCNVGCSTDLNTELRQANTAIERVSILANSGGNTSFVFDFNNPPQSAIKVNPGGKFVNANVATFPALIGMSSAMNFGLVAPCGIIATHMHPRADEILIVIEGRLIVESLTETGSVLVKNELTTLKSTVLNQGSFHSEYNPDCTEAKFIAAFSNNDPGFTGAAPAFFSFNDEAVLGNLGVGNGTDISKEDLASIRLHMPERHFTAEACLKKCGLKPK